MKIITAIGISAYLVVITGGAVHSDIDFFAMVISIGFFSIFAYAGLCDFDKGGKKER